MAKIRLALLLLVATAACEDAGIPATDSAVPDAAAVADISGVHQDLAAPHDVSPADGAPADAGLDAGQLKAKWCERLGGTENESGGPLAVMGGALTLAGNFQSTLSVGPNSYVPKGGAFYYDTFVVQLSDTGSYRWSNHIWSYSYDDAEDLALDSAGDVLVTGGVTGGGADFGGGPTMEGATGTGDLYLAKYLQGTGKLLWFKRLGGLGNLDKGHGVAVDLNDDSVVVVGEFEPPVDFGGGAIATGRSFVAKYTKDGAHLWSRALDTSASYLVAWAVEVDGNGDLIVVGDFRDTVDFGGATPMTATGYDGFVVKLAGSDGKLVWSRQIAGSGWDGCVGAALDAQGGLFVVGFVGGAADFGGGVSPATGSWDAFVASYSAGGGHRWSTRIASTGHDSGQSLAVDGNGDVVVTATIEGAIDIAGQQLTSAGERDILLARLAGATGVPLQAAAFGDTGYDAPYGLATAGQEIYLAGDFAGTIAVGGLQLSSAGDHDIFVCRLAF